MAKKYNCHLIYKKLPEFQNLQKFQKNIKIFQNLKFVSLNFNFGFLEILVFMVTWSVPNYLEISNDLLQSSLEKYM